MSEYQFKGKLVWADLYGCMLAYQLNDVEYMRGLGLTAGVRAGMP